MDRANAVPAALRTLLPALLAALLLPVATGATGATAQAAAPDTVVVVVSADSPVEEIPRLHLADIYLGRTSRFPDGDPAVPIDLAPGSEAREAFYETYLGRSPAEIKAHWSKVVFTGRGRPPRDVPDAAAMKEAVAGNPRAVGYLPRRAVDGTVRVVEVR